MIAPWFAFIESNTSGTGRLFARAARASGYRPVLLSADPQRYPYAAEEGIDVVRADTADEAAVTDVLQRLSQEPELAGVTTSSEYFVSLAATLARRFGLPGPDPEALSACRDKHEQRRRLKSAGVGVPAFRPATSADEALAAAAEIGAPVVVKPVSGSGSMGVKYCATLDEVAIHAASLLALDRNERGQPIPRKILVEAVVSGPEYSVETFGVEVIGITEKHLGPLPYFVETGHDFPAQLEPATAAAVRDAVKRALSALGLGWGPAHTELRLTDAGPVIIEVNPRLAGGFIPEIVRLSTGIDLIADIIALASGRLPECRPAWDKHASIRFVVPSRDGVLASARGLESAAGTPDVVEARMYAKPGDRVLCRRDFRDRIGHVIACGDTAARPRAAADRAIQGIELVIQGAEAISG